MVVSLGPPCYDFDVTHLELAHRFVELVEKHLGDRLISAVLFGSVAIGRERPESDVDMLLVVKDPPRGRFARGEMLEPVHEELDRLIPPLKQPFVSCMIKTPEEADHLSPLYFDMIDRKVVLKDQDGFFAGVLAEVDRRLKKLGAKRKKFEDIEYWDLKPDYVPGEVFEI